MWKWNKKTDISQDDEKNLTQQSELEIVKKAVREFADNAPKGVTTRILVKEDHSIDYHLLKPYLSVTPSKTFYMSKETYEIFEEQDKKIPYYMDFIQQAVDRYVEIYNKIPITPGDPYKKVNYLLLEKNNLIHERPLIDLYITEDENLITHKMPK